MYSPVSGQRSIIAVYVFISSPASWQYHLLFPTVADLPGMLSVTDQLPKNNPSDMGMICMYIALQDLTPSRVLIKSILDFINHAKQKCDFCFASFFKHFRV
jgi:hypothetical protein